MHAPSLDERWRAIFQSSEICRLATSYNADHINLKYLYSNDTRAYAVNISKNNSKVKAKFTNPTPTMHLLNEHYHIYNRGAHKEPIFLDAGDYWRFLCLLYTANDNRTRRVDLRDIKPDKMFKYEREKLADIFTYCLMPNHFHIGIKEITERGIEKFMHKLCTSYAMYYNKKYDHSGTIFQGQYKSKHIDSDDYLRYLVQYIHLNPFGIEEPDMNRAAKSEHLDEAVIYSKAYEYSSFKEYLGEPRTQSGILGTRIDAG